MQELLKEHKDLVEMLNAQFQSSSSSKGGKVRNALFRCIISRAELGKLSRSTSFV